MQNAKPATTKAAAVVRDIAERLLDFASACFGLANRLGQTAAGRYMAGQLMRAGASAGANYQEACGAESRADFIHKLQIVLKELREAHYWLQLICRTGLVPSEAAKPTLGEADELVRIVAKSVVTAKSKLT